MEVKDLKIINKNDLIELKEEFGALIRKIEHFKNNPSTKKIDILRLMKSTIEFRDLLEKL